MKRLTSSILCAALIMLPCAAPAPVPIGVLIAFKIIGTGSLGATAIIIHRATPDAFLVAYLEDGQLPTWEGSKASVRTLRKLNGERWQGPWRTLDEPMGPNERAAFNNANPSNPPFVRCPLGTIPKPVCVPDVFPLEFATNGCNFRPVKAAPDSEIDWTDNWRVCVLLRSRGTNGMTAADIAEVMACDTVITNTEIRGNNLQFRLRN